MAGDDQTQGQGGVIDDPRVRFKAIVRRRDAGDDEGCDPEDVWPEHLRWVADWERYACDTGQFISGCTSPHPTFEGALAEAVAEAERVRRNNIRMLADAA